MNATKLPISVFESFVAWFKWCDKHPKRGKEADHNIAPHIGISARTLQLHKKQLLAAFPGLELWEPAADGGPSKLSEQARQLYALAKQAITAYSEACDWTPVPRKPTIRIGATAGFLYHLLPPALAKLLEQQRDHFGLDLELLDGVGDVVNKVAAGDIDVGFSVRVDERDLANGSPHSRHVRLVPLRKSLDPVLLVPTCANLTRRADGTVTLQALDPFLATKRLFVLPRHRYPQLFDHLENRKMSFSAISVIPSFSVILTFVSLELGSAIVPGFYDRLREHNGTWENGVAYAPLNGLSAIRLAAYVHRNNPHADAVKTVIDTFETEVGALHKPD